MDNFAKIKVPVWLIIGIVLCPLIFAWFTLKNGYSTLARVLSFGWLILSLLVVIALPDQPRPVVSTASIPEVKPAESAHANTPVVVKDTPPQKVVTPVATETATPAKPVKTEVNLGLTPEQFRKSFNKIIKEMDVDGVRPVAEFQLDKSGNAFQATLSDAVGLMGIVTDDGKLKGLIFVMGGTQNGDMEGLKLALYANAAARAISPNLAKEKIGPVLVDLITKAAKGYDDEDNNHRAIIGDVKYFTLASKSIGLWVGMENKNTGK